MQRRSLLACWLIVACLVLIGSGCGSNDTTPEAYPVTGKVNLDGAPLADGRIIFEDIPRGISNAVTVTNGEYSGKVAAGDLKARVVKVEKKKNPMGGDDIETETTLKSNISVTVQTGANTLPTIEIP
jgi:hypothetical protein